MKNSYMTSKTISPCERRRRQLRHNYKQFVNRNSAEVPPIVPTQQSTLTKIIKFLKGESNDNS